MNLADILKKYKLDNLTEANLSGANFYKVKGRNIFTFTNGMHFAYYYDKCLTIGCESHSLNEWLKVYKELGEKNKYTNEQIESYYKFILMLKELEK